jgi:hypothetical protein
MANSPDDPARGSAAPEGADGQASAPGGPGSAPPAGGTSGGGPPAHKPATQPPARQHRSIGRPEFEHVIRRAAELSVLDADAHDQLSEDEVLRIATELGLPAHHVQRALFELPELTVQPRWYDRYFGDAVFTVSRVVPSQAPVTLRRVEDYLVTREYLQIVRRRANNVALVPAEDTISSIARAFFRSGSRHHIAKASRVVVGVHDLPDDYTHVRLDVDLSDARKRSVNGASAAGWFGGIITGGIAAVSVSLATPALGALPEILTFGAGMAATFAVSYSAAASGFKRRLSEARLELTSLLDRLEQGEKLDPPPAPWRRRLQNRLTGPDR